LNFEAESANPAAQKHGCRGTALRAVWIPTMSIKGTFSREISRAVQTHIIRPLTDKAVAATVRHGPTVVKTIAGAVGGVLFRKTTRFPSRQSPIKQASFRIIEESEVKGEGLKPRKAARKPRKAAKK
jgi:hypothetical protein